MKWMKGILGFSVFAAFSVIVNVFVHAESQPQRDVESFGVPSALTKNTTTKSSYMASEHTTQKAANQTRKRKASETASPSNNTVLFGAMGEQFDSGLKSNKKNRTTSAQSKNGTAFATNRSKSSDYSREPQQKVNQTSKPKARDASSQADDVIFLDFLDVRTDGASAPSKNLTQRNSDSGPSKRTTRQARKANRRKDQAERKEARRKRREERKRNRLARKSEL